MKQCLPFLAGAVACAVCFAAGRQSFPWLQGALGEPCGKNTLQWRIAEQGIRQDEPVKASREFDVTRLDAKPTPGGLLVKIDLHRRPQITLKEGDTHWHFKMHGFPEYAAKLVKERFGLTKEPAFEDNRHLLFLISIDGCLTVVSTFNETEVLPQGLPLNKKMQIAASLFGQQIR
jgi:hypothetical protein